LRSALTKSEVAAFSASVTLTPADGCVYPVSATMLSAEAMVDPRTGP